MRVHGICVACLVCVLVAGFKRANTITRWCCTSGCSSLQHVQSSTSSPQHRYEVHARARHSLQATYHGNWKSHPRVVSISWPVVWKLYVSEAGRVTIPGGALSVNSVDGMDTMSCERSFGSQSKHFNGMLLQRNGGLWRGWDRWRCSTLMHPYLPA